MTMINEEKVKAREIADKHKQQCYYAVWGDLDNSFEECYQSALEAMDWKDEQFEKEKQKLIDEACEWIEKLMVASGNYDAYDIQENLKDFKQAMKGEQDYGTQIKRRKSKGDSI